MRKGIGGPELTMKDQDRRGGARAGGEGETEEEAGDPG